MNSVRYKHQDSLGLQVERRWRLAAYASMAFTVGVGVTALCPITTGTVDAAETEAQSADGLATVAISLQNSVDLNITPTSMGEFGVGTANLTVSTTESDGYALYVRAKDGDNSLRSARGDIVTPVGDAVNPSEFQNNTWGYALEKNLNTQTATYRAIPISEGASLVKTEDTSAAGGAQDSYTLAFGAKIDTKLPSGEYKSNVIVSVIASPKQVVFNGITAMQEMTATICEEAATGVSKDLVDTRNNKTYNIFKAKDGNCWMRNNLAIDGTVKGAKITGGTYGSLTLESGNYGDYWDGSTLGTGYKTEYGYYYDFYAATVKTGTSNDYTNATASICPTGGDADANWVLPKLGQDGGAYSGIGSYGALLDAHGGQTVTIATGAELGFQLGGYFYKNNNLLTGVGTYGMYSSRTANSTTNSYILRLYGSTATANSSSRSNGYFVRCLYPSTSTKADVQAQ